MSDHKYIQHTMTLHITNNSQIIIIITGGKSLAYSSCTSARCSQLCTGTRMLKLTLLNTCHHYDTELNHTDWRLHKRRTFCTMRWPIPIEQCCTSINIIRTALAVETSVVSKAEASIASRWQSATRTTSQTRWRLTGVHIWDTNYTANNLSRISRQTKINQRRDWIRLLTPWS